jgi:hypothetical protein
MGLIEHLERYLGPIDSGWSSDADGVPQPFQVARYEVGKITGTVCFSTVGLSRHPLQSRRTNRQIRQELVMCVSDSLRAGPVPALLQQVGNRALSSGRPYLRGDVLGPSERLFVRSELTALYVTLPVYFPDEFAVVAEGDSNIAICWLVPISSGEADFVTSHGWGSFERLLEKEDPNLTDVYRLPIYA